jgi:hypothetical protein
MMVNYLERWVEDLLKTDAIYLPALMVLLFIVIRATLVLLWLRVSFHRSHANGQASSSMRRGGLLRKPMTFSDQALCTAYQVCS